MNAEQNIKGLLALIGIWLTWFIGNLDKIHKLGQVAATYAALFASAVYGVYYLIKIIRKEK